MSFLNKYNKGSHKYKHSIKVNEFIYSIGQYFEGTDQIKIETLLTKLDLNGTIIWEKVFSTDNGHYIELGDLISCDNNDILFSGVYLVNYNVSEFSPVNQIVTTRIDENGNVVWSKFYSLGSNVGGIKLSKIAFETYLLLCNSHIIDSEINDEYYQNELIKFDAVGSVILSKIIYKTNSYNFFRGLDFSSNKIFLSGSNYSYPNSLNIRKGIVLELNLNLEIVNEITLWSDSEVLISIEKAFYKNQYLFFISGRFLFKAIYSNSGIQLIDYKAIDINKSFGATNIIYNDNFIYIEYIDKPAVYITKIDTNFNIVFTKQATNGTPFITKILDQIIDNRIILSTEDLVGLCDLDLNICIFKLITPAKVYDFSLQSSIIIDQRLEVKSLSVRNNTLNINNVQSIKEEICPTIIESPCVKDSKICDLYNTLYDIYVNCLQDPKGLIKNHDTFTDCYKKALEIFFSFIKEHSKEEWTKVLDQYIILIQNYINSSIEENYINAYNAYFYIINFISQQGNCNCENSLEITDFASIQSGNLYLQSAGSVGEDSSKGIHLRWMLRNALSMHLPKGDYASTTNNFNKSDDYVRVYRSKYQVYKTVLDFKNAPLQINETASSNNWVYEVNEKVFYIHFRNATKYNQVRASVNPLDNSLEFLKNYGNSLFEIETKTELSFAISPIFKIINDPSIVRLELLSVLENKISEPRAASLRKKYKTQELNGTKLIAENIRSIRFTSENSFISQVSFEFYSDYILNTKKLNDWELLGKFALTKETNVAFQRLEPQPNILQNWLRYNDEAYVNVSNYKTKWNGSSMIAGTTIQTAVTEYIALSDAIGNPLAEVILPFDTTGSTSSCSNSNSDYHPYIPEDTENLDPNQGFKLSYLEVLQLGSFDYHVARLLGLGTLDLNELVFDGQYIYLAEYTSFGDLNDGLGARKVQHLYCSLPTSLKDQRLPLPVNLKKPVDGVFYNSSSNSDEVVEQDSSQYQENIELTEGGFSQDGQTKYFTLFCEDQIEEDFNAPFYYVPDEFISSEHTSPIYAGIEFKEEGESNWIKPELSHSSKFFNNDVTVDLEFSNETVELVIPVSGKSIYYHGIKQSGVYIFSSYGINWFSRAASSEITWDVEVSISPKNQLLPPNNVVPTLIQKENPLFLTSAFEQAKYAANSRADRTLVRLTFEYNTIQELIDYHQKINGIEINNYSELPNDKEPFADDIEIFFRNQVPNSISGKIKHLIQQTDLLITVSTEPYTFVSTGEIIVPEIPAGLEDNFIGSILLVDSVEYIVHQIDNSGAYPTFILFKNNVSGTIVNMNSVVDSNSNLIIPQEGSLFMVVENMQNLSAWGSTNPSSFKVTIDQTTVYREEGLLFENLDCNVDTHVQKFRGIYENAIIKKHYEKVDINNDGAFDLNSPALDQDDFVCKHLGIYEITFPGFQLDQHSQFSTDENSVEFYNGIVRIHTLNNNGPRKLLKVIRTENIGTSNDLVLFAEDLTFPKDLAGIHYADELAAYKDKLMPIDVDTINQVINYYPGYKLYLYEDDSFNLTEDNVLPETDKDVRYTIFSLRSHDNKNEFQYDNTIDFYSKLSVPAIMFAQAINDPVPPQKPLGGLYATRPDYFGKASYTFTTKYGTATDVHKPHSVQFNRASDVQFLSAIYDNSVLYDTLHQPILNSVQTVMTTIFENGNEPFYVNRWNDLLGFDYPTGAFATFDDKTLPMPDNQKFIQSINNFIDAHNDYYHLTGADSNPHLAMPITNLNQIVIIGTAQNAALTLKDFIKDVLLNCFVPLTEVPVIYDYIKNQPTYYPNYSPIPKKQKVRDRNGQLLNPTTDADFDMAPMMKRIDTYASNGITILNYETQFTDFGLDGASNAKYFYAVREINNQMKTSDYSPIIGPICLVNTAPPIAPQIIKIIPVLENRVLGVNPSIQLQINAYPTAQNIKKINIYRANNPADSLSIRTMKLVKVIDLEADNIQNDAKWIITDDFNDLPQVPFGDPLYYRLTVSRIIKYADKNGDVLIDYAPSEVSKYVLTNVVENYSPESPVVSYNAELYNASTDAVLNYVTLTWNETVYKGNYHLYKMNSQGNWVVIGKVIADRITKGIYHIYTMDTSGNWVLAPNFAPLQSVNGSLYLPLEMTTLATTSLPTKTADGTAIYNHFKVLAENTAGMFSAKENILTMYTAESYHDIGGVGVMIVQGTFIVRNVNI